jgi:alpha-D-ribose 1-methylphosphonate 5-triphosphate synthase subunit PhnH
MQVPRSTQGDAHTLKGGFDEPSTQSARVFRSVMEAMARPGTLHTVTGVTPPRPLSPAAGAVLLTLCDTSTSVHLAGPWDTPDVRGWIAFHTGAPLAGPETCTFALGRWTALGPLSNFPIGTSDYPDRSATLIVECETLEARGATLRGPGIKGTAELSLPEIAAFVRNAGAYPLGLDFIFTCGDLVAGLPRSTKITAPSGVTEVH